jgi:hypothetical protein
VFSALNLTLSLISLQQPPLPQTLTSVRNLLGKSGGALAGFGPDRGTRCR